MGRSGQRKKKKSNSKKKSQNQSQNQSQSQSHCVGTSTAEADYVKARQIIDRGGVARTARRLLERAHSRDPTHVPTILLLADILLMHPGRTVGDAMSQHCIELLESAIRLNVEQQLTQTQLATAHSNLGVLRDEMNELKQAAAHYDEAYANCPKDNAEILSSILNSGGWCKRKGGDLTGSLRFYKEAVKVKPSNSRAHTNLAYTLQQMEQYAESLPHFGRAIELDRFDHLAYYNRGVSLMMLHEWSLAFADFTKTLSLELPDHTASQATKYRNICSMRMHQSPLSDQDSFCTKARRELQTNGPSATLLEQLQDAYSHNTQHKPTLLLLGDLFLAVHASPQDELDECEEPVQYLLEFAELIYERVLSIEPEHKQAVRINYNLGCVRNWICIRKRGRYKGRPAAVSNFDAAYDACPEDDVDMRVLILNARAESWQMAAKLKRAVRDHKKVVQLLPSDARSHARLGATLMKMDRFEAAESALDRAVTLEPNVGLWRLTRGRMRMQLKLYEKALEDFDKLLATGDFGQNKSALVPLDRTVSKLREICVGKLEDQKAETQSGPAGHVQSCHMIESMLHNSMDEMFHGMADAALRDELEITHPGTSGYVEATEEELELAQYYRDVPNALYYDELDDSDSDSDSDETDYHNDEEDEDEDEEEVEEPEVCACAWCGTHAIDSATKRRCGYCHIRIFCSKECQWKDWKTGGHRLQCPEYDHS
jgi:tetratricopeptide (TPR) repeat protein